jgi:hypothetical protein
LVKEEKKKGVSFSYQWKKTKVSIGTFVMKWSGQVFGAMRLSFCHKLCELLLIYPFIYYFQKKTR